MPKRIPTPPPGDDEPKYLAVFQPYPLNAHWELPRDIKQFARWISCCIGSKPFYAFFFKPTARAMVILEIERSFQEFDKLLGEHRWNEFLNNPEEEEKDRVSQIFYSLYKTGREAQKDGWKRINVANEWFTSWSLEDKATIFAYPYPKTHWCDLPVEDRTNKPICRRLPIQNAPPRQPKVIPPVVGSSGWVNAKATDNPVLSAVVGRGTTHPNLTITIRGSKTSRKSAFKSPSTPSSALNYGPPSTGSATTTTLQSPTWTPFTEGSSPASSVAPLQSACPSSNNDTANAVPSTANQAQLQPAMRWADDDGEDQSWWKDPPLGESTKPSSKAVVVPNTGPAYWRNRVAIDQQLVEAIDRLAVDVTVDPDLVYAADWENDVENNESFLLTTESNVAGSEVVDSLWNEEPVMKLGPPKDVCLAHGRICKKGICQEYTMQLRNKRREEEREAREEAKKNRKKKGKQDKSDGSICGASNCNSSQPARSVAGSNSSSNSNKKHGSDDAAFSVISSRHDDASWRRGDTKRPQDDDSRTVMAHSWKNRGWAESLASTKTESLAGSDRLRDHVQPPPW